METSAFAREAPSRVDADADHPVLDLRHRLAQGRRDLVALGDEAADHEHHDHGAEHEQADAGR